MGYEKFHPDFTERRKNIVEIETASASYFLVYSDHETLNDDVMVKEADAVILELAESEAYNKESVGAVLVGCADQYQKVYEAAVKDKKPIFLVDMAMDEKDYEAAKREYAVKQFGIPAAEASLAALAISSGIKDLKKEKNLSRRNFLKGGAKVLAGAYLSTPAISQVGLALGGPVPDERSLIRQTAKVTRQISSNTHPEIKSKILDVRNNLMAQKSETIARSLKKESKGKKPKIIFFIGAGHSGIEASLNELESVRVEGLISDLGSDIVRHNKIIRIDPEKGDITDAKISIFTDPVLVP